MLDQLTHIEDSTEERDLSPVVTDKLRKNFYVQQLGAKSTSVVVVDRMKQKRVSFSWRQFTPTSMLHGDGYGNGDGDGNGYLETAMSQNSRSGYVFGNAEVVQRAATIAEAKSGIKIEVTHLERILPQANFRSLRGKEGSVKLLHYSLEARNQRMIKINQEALRNSMLKTVILYMKTYDSDTDTGGGDSSGYTRKYTSD
ncbi:hypothetical protein Tco_0736674 [Tanacetum coccineum]